VSLIEVPSVGKCVSAIRLTQAITGKDINAARNTLNGALASNVDLTRTKAEAVLHRKVVVQGFINPTWVVTYDEALQLVSEVLPDKYTEHVKKHIRSVFQRVEAGDQTLHSVIDANARSTGVRAQLARDGLGISQQQHELQNGGGAFNICNTPPLPLEMHNMITFMQCSVAATENLKDLAPTDESKVMLLTHNMLMQALHTNPSDEIKQSLYLHTIELQKHMFGLPQQPLQPTTAIPSPDDIDCLPDTPLFANGILYAVFSMSAATCKIGITTKENAKQRIAQFRLNLSDSKQIDIVYCNRPRNIEKRLQVLLRAYSTSNETFKITEKQTKAIFSAVRRFTLTQLGQAGIYDSFELPQRVIKTLS
jgi:hypothetical protein